MDEAVKIVDFALEVVDAVAKYLRLPDRCAISVRIGLNSGSAMAGIIGEQRLAFDLWGHAVNMASGIESSSFVNHINLSEATYEFG